MLRVTPTSFRKTAYFVAALAALVIALTAAPRPFRVYLSLEPQDNVPLPADFGEKTEYVFARLMYPPHPQARFTRRRMFGGPDMDSRTGGTSWSQDYPRADRHFASALRRLTRVHVRSVEQPVNPDDGDDIYEWPFLTAGEMGDWLLTDAQCAKLRDYLLRGGFLFLDDFWGTEEWNRFMESMGRVFPDRPIVEIEDENPIFHSLYDITERFQIPGAWGIRRGTTFRNDGEVPHWRGIMDDKGRVMVVMTFNHDVGDSWEYADERWYPERYSSLGIRLGVNFVLYSMTH